GAVTLGNTAAPMTIAAAGNVTFGSSVDGAVNLTVTPGASGFVAFDGDVGNSTPLAALTLAGFGAEINCMFIGVSGDVDFNDRAEFDVTGTQTENVIEATNVQFSQNTGPN